MKSNTPCPNCGRKSFHEKKKGYESKLCSKDATHYCDKCDMEFKKIFRKGEMVWEGHYHYYT